MPGSILRAIRWTEVVAFALCIAGAGLVFLWASTYVPEPRSAQDLAATRALALANCGEGMMDVAPQDASCPAYDTVALSVIPCFGHCDAFTLTLHDDGKAELDGQTPDGIDGKYKADIGKRDFRRIANLVATMKLELREYSPAPPDVGDRIIRAGCKGRWTVDANDANQDGDIAAVAKCLRDIRQHADWSTR